MNLNDLPVGHIIYADNHVELPEFAKRYCNLASGDNGAKVVSCSDEWFASADRMLSPSSPIFIVGKFDDHGKWMDGWETRRKRYEGYDYAIVKLGLPGVIHGVDIDTSHFTGNFPPAGSIEGCYAEDEITEQTQWIPLLPSNSLGANAHHFFAIKNDQVFTHIRLNIYPDGGVARLRVYGQPVPAWSEEDRSHIFEVSALANGGRVVAVSNAHFGLPRPLLTPGRGINMGDGWETARRRVPGNEWCIIELGHACEVERIEVDTAHFKGNYPDRVSIQASNVNFGTEQSIITQSMFWDTLLPPHKLEMDKQHFFEKNQLNYMNRVTHVKLNIHPDGGVSRFRVWGKLVK